jgi:hypothetical protein
MSKRITPAAALSAALPLLPCLSQLQGSSTIACTLLQGLSDLGLEGHADMAAGATPRRVLTRSAGWLGGAGLLGRRASGALCRWRSLRDMHAINGACTREEWVARRAAKGSQTPQQQARQPGVTPLKYDY